MAVNEIVEADKLLHIGEINTDRGLAAKRNLFIFCSTYLIVFINRNIDLEDLTIFGMTPFTSGTGISYWILLIIFVYLFLYWAYHYYQGWLIWHAKSSALVLKAPINPLKGPINLFFGQKSFEVDGYPYNVSFTIVDVEKEDQYQISKQLVGVANSNTSVRVSFAAKKFLKNQILVFRIGIYILLFFSFLTFCGLVVNIYQSTTSNISNSNSSISRGIA